MKLGKPEVKPALMQALFALTGGSAVAMRDEVKIETFKVLGIDPDSLGVITKGAKAGTKIADKLVSACFSELKKDGLTHSPLRNRYALTDGGVSWCEGQKFANALETVQAPLTASTPDPVVVPVEAAPVAAPIQIEEPKKKVMPAPVPAPVVERTIDPYILSLMVQSSPCYGVSPSTRAKTCKGCPVLAQCQLERNTRLVELAASLESQAARLEVVDLSAEKAVPAPEPVLPEDAITVPIDVEGMVCEHCHSPIEKDTKGVILKGHGIFHPECVAAAAAQKQLSAATA